MWEIAVMRPARRFAVAKAPVLAADGEILAEELIVNARAQRGCGDRASIAIAF
jgi:hypothetical protein